MSSQVWFEEALDEMSAAAYRLTGTPNLTQPATTAHPPFVVEECGDVTPNPVQAT